MSYQPSNRYTVTYPDGKVYEELNDEPSLEAFLMSRFGRTTEEVADMGIKVEVQLAEQATAETAPPEGADPVETNPPEQPDTPESNPEGAAQGGAQGEGSEPQNAQ